MCIVVSCLVCIVAVVLCVLLSSYVYLLYYVCVYCCFYFISAGLLAISQYSEGPATGHLDTGFSWFPCAYKQMRDGSQDSKLPLHASHVALPT